MRAAMFAVLAAAFVANAQTAQQRFEILAFHEPAMVGNTGTDQARLQALAQAGFNLVGNTNNMDPPPGYAYRANAFNYTAWGQYKISRTNAVPGLQIAANDDRFCVWDTQRQWSQNANQGAGGWIAGWNLQPYNDATATAIVNDHTTGLPGGVLQSTVVGYNVYHEVRPDDVNDALAWVAGLRQKNPTRLAYAEMMTYNEYPATGVAGDPPYWASYAAYRDNYVRPYFENAATQVSSFNRYPFWANGDWHTYGCNGISHYYQNHADFAALSTANNKTYWAYVLTVPHMIYGTPTLPQMRFMVNVPLVYGAKGIGFFTYAPPGDRDVSGNFVYGDALLNRAYNINQTMYDRVQGIALQLGQMGPMLMALQWQAVAHGSSTDPFAHDANQVLVERDLPVAPQSFLTGITSTHANAMAVGCFSSSWLGTATLVMNKDCGAQKRATMTVQGSRYPYQYVKTLGTWQRLERVFDQYSNRTSYDVAVDQGDMEPIVMNTVPYTRPVRDMNGDGNTDRVHFGSTSVNIHRGNANGTATSTLGWSPWAGYPVNFGYAFLDGDFNGDGRSDFLHIVAGNNYARPWLGLTSGTYTVTQTTIGYTLPSSDNFRVGNFDGANGDDVIEFAGDRARIWTNQGNATFQVNPNYTPWAGYGVGSAGQYIAGDFDGDGRDDLVHFVPGTDYVNVWYGQPGIGFAVYGFWPWGAGYGVGNASQYRTADYNGDGATDLVHYVPGQGYANVWYGSATRGSFNLATWGN